MTILGSAKQDRKIKTQALVIFEGKKDTVVYHGELLDSNANYVSPWRWQWTLRYIPPPSFQFASENCDRNEDFPTVPFSY